MKRIVAFLICLAVLYSCRGWLGELFDPPDDRKEASQSGGADKPSDAASDGDLRLAVNYSYMKGMWLSQYDLFGIYTDGGRQREKSDFTALIGRVLDNVRNMGFNTVIMQTRPFGDSFYPSEYFPMSAYAVGTCGGEHDYDAFAVAVDQAHARGLSVHAWVNPLRAMRTDELSNISGDYPIKTWYDESLGETVVEVLGRIYLNPACPEARRLVCDGIAEIVREYPVDGIHIDDYFYPTTDASFDRTAYTRYRNSGGNMSLDDFRREQISSLIREIYSAVKDENESVLFGVSPSGNIRDNYDKLYADVALWCSEDGYLDYLCPQIYFGFEHSTHAFDKVCDDFAEMVKAKGVRLTVGMTLGKAAAEHDAYAGEGRYEWRDNKDVLRRSLEKVYSTSECRGICFFSYQYFYDPVSGESVRSTEEERSNFVPMIKNR